MGAEGNRCTSSDLVLSNIRYTHHGFLLLLLSVCHHSLYYQVTGLVWKVLILVCKYKVY